MKKYIICLFVFCSSFFLNYANVNAETVKYGTSTQYTGTPSVTTCKYSSSDGKTKAEYYIKLGGYLGYDTGNEHNVKITSWKGTSNPAGGNEPNLSSNLTATATLECPKYMVIYRSGGYNVYTFVTKENAENKKNNESGVLLTRTSDYFSNVQYLQTIKDSVFYNSQLNVTEPYNYCKYKINDSDVLELGMSTQVITASDVGGYATTTDENGISCPTVAYAIVKNSNNQIVFKFHGSWPEVCADDGYTCFKYTSHSNRQKYGEEVEIKDVQRSATYYRSALTMTGVDPEDKLTLDVKGKSDGTIESVNMKINGQTVYFGEGSQSDIDSYFRNILISADFQDRIYCDYKDKMDKNGIVFSTTINGNIPPSDYTGLYCTVFVSYAEASYVLSTLSYDNEDVTSVLNDITTFNALVGSVPDFCNSSLMTETEYSDCISKQNAFYEKAKKIVKKCKKIYSNMLVEIKSDPIVSCDTFINTTIPQYAEEGYFGNRIITTEMDNDCSTILGSLGVWLKRIYDIMKYAVPVIIVVFGIKDFISATISGKDDALKKASSTFVKRLIWGAVFVAIPVLVTMILTFAFGGGFADICIF